jgi:hypothetical protein
VLSAENQVQSFDVDWNIYPNPTAGEITLKCTLAKPSKIKINVIDELGKKVKATHLYKGIKGGNNIKLDLFSLKSGIYFVTLTIEGKQFTQQIIKK